MSIKNIYVLHQFLDLCPTQIYPDFCTEFGIITLLFIHLETMLYVRKTLLPFPASESCVFDWWFSNNSNSDWRKIYLAFCITQIIETRFASSATLPSYCTRLHIAKGKHFGLLQSVNEKYSGVKLFSVQLLLIYPSTKQIFIRPKV